MLGYVVRQEAFNRSFVFSILANAVHAAKQSSSSEAVSVATAMCESHVYYSKAYKCDCFMEFFVAQHKKNPADHVNNLYADALLASGRSCADTEGFYLRTLHQCAENFPYMADDHMNQLGLRKYCHCVADKAVERPMAEAMAACTRVKDHTVPANSPLPE